VDMLRSIALCAAFLVPVVAGARDLGSQDLAPMALDSYTASPKKIDSAQVFDQRGRLVGSVKGIVTDAAGKPDAISIQPSGGRPLMVVAAGDVSYDRERNIVVTAVEPQGIASAK
jgi:hypothetical protein